LQQLIRKCTIAQKPVYILIFFFVVVVVVVGAWTVHFQITTNEIKTNEIYDKTLYGILDDSYSLY
jgi:hypothetical protein